MAELKIESRGGVSFATLRIGEIEVVESLQYGSYSSDTISDGVERIIKAYKSNNDFSAINSTLMRINHMLHEVLLAADMFNRMQEALGEDADGKCLSRYIDLYDSEWHEDIYTSEAWAATRAKYDKENQQ
jgi:hypothetical protein